MSRRAALFALVAITALGMAPLVSQKPTPVWTLTEDLRIGGATDGPTDFVDVRGLALTRHGNIFVLDYSTQELRVFDSAGTFARRAARRGAGPGELSDANGIAIGDDDVVWASDHANSRFSLYRADGHYLRQVLIPITSYGYIWPGSVVGPDRIVDNAADVATGKLDPLNGGAVRESRLRHIYLDGHADTTAFPVCPPKAAVSGDVVYGKVKGSRAYMSLPFLAYMQYALTRQNTVWCTPSDEYRLLYGTVGGVLREVVHRSGPPVRVSDAERSAAMHRIDSMGARFGPLLSGDLSATPRVKPVIAALFTDDQGRAWVRRTAVDSMAPDFEVYDGSGRQVAEVHANGRVGSQVFVAGDALLTVITDDDDLPWVVRYRIGKHPR
ncbi:MAG: 6-bladed beta-propeller [Gemmatimonadales bacterium]